VIKGYYGEYSVHLGSANAQEIELSGDTVTTWWGRIGAAGQSKSKKFADAAKAKAEYDKLVAEKTGKGYNEGT
jgi:predicted DNA-binding WGR domain protein